MKGKSALFQKFGNICVAIVGAFSFFPLLATADCVCKPGYSKTGPYCVWNANSAFFTKCGFEPDPPNPAYVACGCPAGFHVESDSSGVHCLSMSGSTSVECGVPTPVVDTTVTTNTSSSTAAQTFNSAIATSIDTKPISQIGETANGEQISSLESAAQAAALGAAQAATIGAVNCAEGANANLTNATDAAAFYAICQQNFNTAKGLTGKAGGFNPDNSIVDGAIAQKSLDEFEKNFSVSKEEFLKRMLGEGGGPASLSGLLDGKISEAKLAEAMDAASKLGPSDLTQDPNKFTVDLGLGSKKTNGTLRDTLKKKLGEKSDAEQKARSVASKANQRDEDKSSEPRLEGLVPLRESIFENTGSVDELTIFDVVHLKYQKLTRMMQPGKKLSPPN